MSYYKTTILLVLLLFIAGSSFCQQPAITDIGRVINDLKALQTYSFDAEINAVFPDGTKQKTTMVMCMDKPNKRLYYSNTEQTLLITSKWAFQAYHRSRKASVFDVVKYNKKYKESLPELQHIFSDNMLTLYVDSFLLKSGKLKSGKRNGNLTTYELSFPEDNMIKGMTIVLNNSTGMPETITMKTFRPSAEGRYNKSKGGTTIETICRNYSKKVREGLLDPMKYFQVKAGKAYLLQYKNYALTSIL